MRAINPNQAMSNQLIVKSVRDQIISGKYKPGDRLQPRAEFEKLFNTTPNTVQRAFNQLVDDGFVIVVPKKGTYVTDCPPNQYNYALLIRSPQNSPGWTKYWSTMKRVADDLNDATPYNISIRPCIDIEFDTEEYHALLDDINLHRLGGLIFAFDPELAVGTPLLEKPDLPRVSLMSHNMSGIPVISYDNNRFCDRALDFLKQANRKRIAAIVTGGMMKSKVLTYLKQEVTANGMVFDDCWIQGVGIEHKECAQNLVRLLLKGDPNDRPDGLIIFDDNLVNPVCAGIIQTGLQVGTDLDVVAHTNFPLFDTDIIPITRLGYDVREVFSNSLELMEKQRQGHTCSDSIIVEPVFADELDQNSVLENLKLRKAI